MTVCRASTRRVLLLLDELVCLVVNVSNLVVVCHPVAVVRLLNRTSDALITDGSGSNWSELRAVTLMLRVWPSALVFATATTRFCHLINASRWIESSTHQITSDCRNYLCFSLPTKLLVKRDNEFLDKLNSLVCRLINYLTTAIMSLTVCVIFCN